jgi:hypothetical protein
MEVRVALYCPARLGSPDARSLARILRGQVLAAQDDVKF